MRRRPAGIGVFGRRSRRAAHHQVDDLPLLSRDLHDDPSVRAGRGPLLACPSGSPPRVAVAVAEDLDGDVERAGGSGLQPTRGARRARAGQPRTPHRPRIPEGEKALSNSRQFAAAIVSWSVRCRGAGPSIGSPAGKGGGRRRSSSSRRPFELLAQRSPRRRTATSRSARSGSWGDAGRCRRCLKVSSTPSPASAEARR